MANTPLGLPTGVHFTLIGWILFLAGLAIINKNPTGHKIIFYSILLILLYLLVFNYRKISSIAFRRG